MCFILISVTLTNLKTTTRAVWVDALSTDIVLTLNRLFGSSAGCAFVCFFGINAQVTNWYLFSKPPGIKDLIQSINVQQCLSRTMMFPFQTIPNAVYI